MNSLATRRTFLQSAAVVTGASLFPLEARAAANERITLGFIGVGMMGRGHLGNFLSYKDVQVVAIAEVEGTRREHAVQNVNNRYSKEKKGSFNGCRGYSDFRELLARDDIDAVVIATPDHWHAANCILAARAKKDIYCEKPLTHNIREGRILVDTVAKHKIVFQTGSQQRSEFAGRFRRAVELVQNGAIGKLKTVRIGVGAPPVPCDLPNQEKPDNVDWNMWVGPAPMRDYNEVLCPKGIHRHFPAFRRYREFAGGGLADMGAHHFDIAQWAMGMDSSGPVAIAPPDDGKKTGLKLTYASGVEMFHGGPSGCTFEGSEGTIYVDRPTLRSTPSKIVETKLGPDAKSIYPSNNHRRNWIDCIKSRKQAICPAEVGHRTATVCHLANIGYQLAESLKWDPAKEEFIGNEAANKLVYREPRSPWSYEA